MTEPLPRYALQAFTHLARHIRAGQELDGHDELVQLRPDLFTTEPPAKPTGKAKKKEA